MIFFMLLFVAGGALCIYAFVSEGSFQVSGWRLLLATFGVALLVLGGWYVFPQLFVILNFPKYPKLRRIFFNSDIYFTDSTSNEYFGGSRTLRGRMNKAAFDTVTIFAEAEKGLDKKKPIRYTVYCVFMLLFGVIGLAYLFAMPLLFENGIIFSNMSDGTFLFFWVLGTVVCIALAIFFLFQAYKALCTAPLGNFEWTYELYSALANIAVRKNNKKFKFWYKREQIEQIENIVKNASKNAEIRFETKGNKIISFTVIDVLNNSVQFTGYFV